MDYMVELSNIAKNNGGIFETKTATSYGISKMMLSKLCKQKEIVRVARGQYILSDDIEDELLALSNRSEKIVFSHETALFLHGLSDRTPFENSFTVPSTYTASAAIRHNHKTYYIKPDLFDLGKTEIMTARGNMVPAYDIDRTICDIVRSRNKIGTETFLFSLKQYAASPKKDLNKLSIYAKKLHVETIIRQYMEVLL